MMRRFKGGVSLGLGLLVIGSQLLGCSNAYKVAKVRGRVTCQGKPAVGGEVTFQPIDAPEKTGRPTGQSGRSSRGVVGEDGTFTLSIVGMEGSSGDGALIGPHRVYFKMPPTKRPTISKNVRELMSPEDLKAEQEALSRVPVYAPLSCGADMNPEEVEVKSGGNDFEFTLQPKKAGDERKSRRPAPGQMELEK